MDDRAWSGASSSQKRIFLDSLDTSLSELLDDGVRDALYAHLENTHSLKGDDIPDRLGDFVGALRGLTGRASKVIERAVAKNFYSRMGIDFEARPDFGLSDYLEAAMMKGHDGS